MAKFLVQMELDAESLDHAWTQESELENIRPAMLLEVTTRPIWKTLNPRRL
jgi:hypothetical protein